MTFEGNIGNRRDLPLVAYIDFQTTAPVEDFLTAEQNEMFVVSYTLVLYSSSVSYTLVNRIVVQGSLGHSLTKLGTVDYFTEDQLKLLIKT